MSSAIPLAGADRVKVVLFFLVLAGTIFFGVIPILISLAGIYIMKKDKSFSPITTSKKYIKIYLIMLALGATAIAGVEADDVMVVGVVLILTLIAVSLLMSLFAMLYFRPLEKHQEWVVKNGIFSDLKEDKDDDSTGIMGRDKLSSFSVADELIKWNDLLEKNLISQGEFDKAKQKLLNQKS